jgi:tRNA dimethylallyltransferase
MKNKIVVILGPTSSGKTRLAVKLAGFFNGEIVSADSRQVYKGMDVGTGKDLAEYGQIPHHLIDVVSPKKQFTLADYQKKTYKAIDKILKKGKLPFLVGGSGLYLQSIIDGYLLTKARPQKSLREFLNFLTLEKLQKMAEFEKIKLNQSDFNNKRRLIRAIETRGKGQATRYKEQIPKYDCLQLGLTLPRKELNKKISQRLKDRLEKEGLIEEVKRLHQKGVSYQRLDDFGLEYRFVAKYLQGELTYEAMSEKLGVAICQFAKRQMTWFKRDKKIHWLKDLSQAKKIITDFIK